MVLSITLKPLQIFSQNVFLNIKQCQSMFRESKNSLTLILEEVMGETSVFMFQKLTSS